MIYLKNFHYGGEELNNLFLRWPLLCFQGIIVGMAAILPGASEGVLCVVFGIYEPMMALLAHPVRLFRRYYKMFIPFLIGWTTGFILLARAASWLFEMVLDMAMAFFAGLICGTIPNLIKKSHNANPLQSWSPFVISMVIVFALLGFLQTSAINTVIPNVGWYLFCGISWGLSLVVPGLSSSSIVIFLGLYQPMAAGIAGLDMAVILPMLCGMLITVLLCTKLINKLFEKQYAFVTKIVLGIIIASTLLIIPTTFTNIYSTLFSALCFGAGFILARKMTNIKGIGEGGKV